MMFFVALLMKIFRTNFSCTSLYIFDECNIYLVVSAPHLLFVFQTIIQKHLLF